jgi:uncharacterized membrane protein YphA (DoxX/SURF4 family)
MNDRLTSSYWTLRIAFGLTAFLAGLDKFFNLLTNWEQYLSPLATSLIPLAPHVIMRVAGVIEMAAGLIVLAGLTRLGAYVISAWLVVIAIGLLTTGRFFDVAVRDIVMAIGAFTLARLAEARDGLSASWMAATRSTSTAVADH